MTTTILARSSVDLPQDLTDGSMSIYNKVADPCLEDINYDELRDSHDGIECDRDDFEVAS